VSKARLRALPTMTRALLTRGSRLSIAANMTFSGVFEMTG
jgi:hypothetical protein